MGQKLTSGFEFWMPFLHQADMFSAVVDVRYAPEAD
jgi:hypothetical protein